MISWPQRGIQKLIRRKLLKLKHGERGRNRTYNLLIKSRSGLTFRFRPCHVQNQQFAITLARTEALEESSEKGRIGA
jgi:hypothetical protein